LPPSPPLFPYTTLFRSERELGLLAVLPVARDSGADLPRLLELEVADLQALQQHGGALREVARPPPDVASARVDLDPAESARGPFRGPLSGDRLVVGMSHVLSNSC